MLAWASRPETPGASPPGLALDTHGASQPVGDGVVTCPALRIVSFNFGIEQNMLTSERQWAQKHVYKFRDLLRSMGNTFSHDFIFGSEMGGVDQGFDEARVCMKHIVNGGGRRGSCRRHLELANWWTRVHALASLPAHLPRCFSVCGF